MGIIEEVQAREAMKQKAAAYDAANRERELAQVLSRGRDEGMAAMLNSIRQDELNALAATGYREPQMPYRDAPAEMQYQNQVENYGLTNEDRALRAAIESGNLPSPREYSPGLAEELAKRSRR